MAEKRLIVDDILRLFKEARLQVEAGHGVPHVMVDVPTIVVPTTGQKKGVLGVVAMWTNIHGVYGGGFRLKWTNEALLFSAWDDTPSAVVARVEYTFRAVPAYDYVKIGLMGVRLL